MSDLDTFLGLKRRLDAGEPVRILIGHTLHRASEIVPSPGFATVVRDVVAADVARAIARLREPQTIAPEGN